MNRSSYAGRAALSLTVALAIAGCGTAQVKQGAEEDTQRNVEAIEANQERLAQQLRDTEGLSRQIDRPWVNTRAIAYERPLPPVFDDDVDYSLTVETPGNLVVDMISQRMGIPAFIERDVFNNPDTEDREADLDDSVADSAGAAPGALLPPPTVSELQESHSLAPRIQVSYTGDYIGLLDHVAAKLEASWRYDHESQRIIFYRYKTGVFNLSALPGAVDLQAAVGSQLSSSDGSSRNTAEISGAYDPWEDILGALENLVTDEGRVSVSQSSGTLVVRDHPEVVKRVESFVETTNASLKREVVVDVAVYSVTFSESDARALDWNALFESATGSVGLEVSSPATNQDGVAALTLTAGEGNWEGTEGIIRSLERVGEVSQLTSSQLRTVNNMPAPFRAGETVHYLAEVTPTQTADTVIQTGASLDEVDVGFSLNVIPQIQSNSEDVLMRIALNMNTLEELMPVEAGETVLQAPRVSRREQLQQVWLNSGEPLILSGFELVSSSVDQQGIVNASAWWAGGRSEASRENQRIIVVMTPRVTRL